MSSNLHVTEDDLLEARAFAAQYTLEEVKLVGSESCGGDGQPDFVGGGSDPNSLRTVNAKSAQSPQARSQLATLGCEEDRGVYRFVAKPTPPLVGNLRELMWSELERGT